MMPNRNFSLQSGDESGSGAQEGGEAGDGGMRSGARGTAGAGGLGTGARGLAGTRGCLGTGDAISGSGSVDLSRLGGDALRRGWDTSDVGDLVDGTESLGRLLVDDVIASGILVVAGEVLTVALAGLEGTVNVSSGSVVGATDTIVDMFTELGGVGASRVASLETEGVSSHEVVPLDDLGVLVLVSPAGWECIGEDEATKGVATLISAVGIHLTSGVVRLDVDQGLVDMPSDLDIVGGLHELNAGEGASGDDTGATTGLSAPGDGLALGVADDGVGLGSTPQAKVVDGVDHGRLALGLLVFSGGTTLVETELRATFASAGVSLVGEVVPVKVPGGKRNTVLSESDSGESEEGETTGSHR